MKGDLFSGHDQRFTLFHWVINHFVSSHHWLKCIVYSQAYTDASVGSGAVLVVRLKSNDA